MAEEYDEVLRRDHSVRIRKLEERAAVTENTVERLEKLPNLISTLRDTVVELKTQTKVTWALLILVFASMVTAIVAIVQSGIPLGVP